MRVSLSEIWGSVFIFVQRNAGLLFPLALSLLAVGQFGFAQIMSALVSDGVSAAAIAAIPVTMLMIVTCLAAVRALVLFQQISVAEAIGLGFRRSPKILVVVIILSLFRLLVSLPIMLAVRSGGPEQVGAATAIFSLAGILVYFYVTARLLCFSAMIVERDLPLGEAVVLSWHQTAANHLSLFGMVILLQIIGDLVGLSFAATFAVILSPIDGVAQEPGLSALLALFCGAMATSIVLMTFTVFSTLYYRRVADAN